MRRDEEGGTHTNLPWKDDSSCSRLAPPSAATLTEALRISVFEHAVQCRSPARRGLGEKLRTVLPQLAQVAAAPQRLVQHEQGELLGDVVVLQQLGGAPFEGLLLRGHDEGE